MIEICLTVLKLRANCTQPCFIYQSASLLLFHRCSTSLLFSRILLPRRSGETRKSVSAHVTPRASEIWQLKLYHLRLNINFPVTGKRQVSFFFFLSFFVNSVSIDWIRAALRVSLSLSESQYSPGWCQLSSSGHSDATSLPVNTASAASQCDLWWVCTVPALSACWCVMMPSGQ